jgi:hypothetical protein
MIDSMRRKMAKINIQLPLPKTWTRREKENSKMKLPVISPEKKCHRVWEKSF